VNERTSCKAKDLQVTLKLLLSVKADGVEEQIQQFESKLATMKKRITQLKDLDSVNHTAKINSQIYPNKTEAEIKAHLESVCKLEIRANHTHALLSASVSKLLAGSDKGETQSICALARPQGSFSQQIFKLTG